jgi:hypothetical protein
MPSPTSPSTPSSSNTRMLALLGGVLALVAVLCLAFGRSKSGSEIAKPSGDEGKPPVATEDRPSKPGSTPIDVAPTRASGQVRATTGEAPT